MKFKEIYKVYSPKIFRVCMAYINDYEQARDLTQETFIVVWQNLSSFRNESQISTWILNTLQRTQLDMQLALRNCVAQNEAVAKKIPKFWGNYVIV